MKKHTYLYLFLILSLVWFSSCNNIEQGEPADLSSYNLYWGDIHNHNAVGYAKGSLERSYEIAQSHLDFFCFTGHSQWHDMPIMPQNKHMKWVKGFEVMRNNWDKVVSMANVNNKQGKFVTFIGYEWHSNSVGDVCIIHPGSKGDLVYINDFKEFQKYAQGKGAILVPHHPAYKTNWRGQDWSVLNTLVSPVAEIFSEHGNAESDRSPLRYIRHSMSGRVTHNTFQSLWNKGEKIGIIASSDDHLGYPGAYGEGLAGVYAENLTRESIFEAIKNRRTYAVNADRIGLDFRLNGKWMGEILPSTTARKLKVKVEGKDVVDRVEVLRNNRVIHRDFPIDRPNTAASWDKPVLCRIEFGWGPWGDLNMARICDWEFTVRVKNGIIKETTPCFQSGPFDENRRNKLTKLNKNSCQVVSYTSRMKAYEERATNSIVLKIQGSPQTKLDIQFSAPKDQKYSTTLGNLAGSSEVEFTGPFTSESFLIHRIVFSENYQTEFEITDDRDKDQDDWYYVRVIQTNNSYAWSSPIWLSTGKYIVAEGGNWKMLIETKLGKYKWIENWAKIPDTSTGRKNGRTHNVVSAINGDIIVCHQATPSILIYNEDGNLISSWGDLPGIHGMSLIYENDREYLWLTDEFSHKVVKMSLDGREVMSLSPPDHSEYRNGKQFIPTWASQNPKTGEIWVADGYGAYLVHRYSPDGEYLMSLDGTEGAGRFIEPHGIQFSKNSESPELFITDRANHRIVVYDGNGEFIRSGLSAHSPCCFDIKGDHILVPELFTGVKVLDYKSLDLIDEFGANEQIGPKPDGSWWPPICPDGWPDLAATDHIRPGLFNSPHGACFAPNGDVYVVEWIIGGRITKLEKQQ